MDYTKIYESVIDIARHRKLDCYVEKHHVLPKCIGGENGEQVELTAREHFIAHQLLAKMHPKEHGLIFSAYKMANAKDGRANSKDYAWLRERYGAATADRNRLRKGEKRKPRDEQTKLKISIALRGQKLSKETRKKMSKAHLGKKKSAETKQRMSEARQRIERAKHGEGQGT